MGHFYFLRHAPTINNQLGIRCGGDLDLPLVENFLDFLREPILALQGLGIQTIYTSSLVRTMGTARAIADASDPTPSIVVDDRFKERGLGALNSQDIQATQPFLTNPPSDAGVECGRAFSDRVNAAMDGLLQNEGADPRHVLVVGSKGPARVLSEKFPFELCGGRRELYGNCQLIKFFVA
jgi:2,3-bisphosphoglycerate-dependent phosphoglycerate mutase